MDFVELEEFPQYFVNPLGEIYNRATHRDMRYSRTPFGHVKVSLINEHGRFTRSVSKLVAEAFVEKPNPMCDKVIMLDGTLDNVRADNLAWRSGWFAWKYTRQLKIVQPDHYWNLPIRNPITCVEYDSVIHAGVSEGLLFDDIWRSTYMRTPVQPGNHFFEVIERV